VFTSPRPNLYESSDGFSVEVLGRTGLCYREASRQMFVDSEVLTGPFGMAVYKDIIHKGREQGSEWACSVFSDSEEGIISGLFGFKVDWGLVVKTGVESGAVVEGFDVMKDGATRFG
jgi:hypothetical protein